MGKIRLQGKNSSSIQEMNRSSVLRYLKKHDICSRAELANKLGLQQATITNIINDFLEWDLVIETGLISGNKGRRRIGLQINQKEYFVIGLRLRRSSYTVGLFDIFGENITAEKIAIDKNRGPEIAVQDLKQSIRKLLEGNKDKRIIGIGIAVPGPYFKDKGVITSITDFPGWEQVSFKDEMTKEFDIPVIIDLDSNAGALAEWWIANNEMLYGTMVYIAAGAGIGAGIMDDGKIFRGALGIAGEIGHISINFNGPICECGNRGCLTNYVSTTYMCKRVNEELINYPNSILMADCTFPQLVDAINYKDPLAMMVFNETMESLAIGIVNVIFTYGPNEIVISDELTTIGPIILDTLKKLIKERDPHNIFEAVNIKLGSFEKDTSFVGAAALAIDHCLSEPSVFDRVANHRLSRVTAEK